MGAQRIVSLLAAGTEILYGLGLGDRVAAVSHECDFPPEALHKPRVTRSAIADSQPSRAIDEQVRDLVARRADLYAVDVALIESLAPDLIVTQSQCDVCAVSYDDVAAAVANSSRLMGTTIVTLNPVTLADVFDDIRRVAVAAGASDAGESYVASLKARVDVVRRRTADLPGDRRPRTVCIEWIDPLIVAANWMPELIELAGGAVAPTTTAGAPSRYAEWASVRGFDPDVIVVMPCGFDLARTVTEASALDALPGWRDVSAVAAGRVFAADGNAYFNRSGPRIVDSLEILARLLHPGMFSDLGDGGTSVWRRLGEADAGLL